MKSNALCGMNPLQKYVLKYQKLEFLKTGHFENYQKKILKIAGNCKYLILIIIILR